MQGSQDLTVPPQRQLQEFGRQLIGAHGRTVRQLSQGSYHLLHSRVVVEAETQWASRNLFEDGRDAFCGFAV